MKLFQKLAGVLAVCGLLPYAHASDPPENDVLAQDSLFADFPEQVQDSNLHHNDPLELLNRFTFALNGAINVLIIRPSTEVYVFFVPEFIRIGIHHFLQNLKEPVVLVNAILQNDAATAQTTGIRFSLNTVFGFGLLDVATNMGYAERERDFGQTLALWGSGESWYLVLPLFGPSSVRDGTGIIVDRIFHPQTHLEEPWRTQMSVVEVLDKSSFVLSTEKALRYGSVDYYARVRSVYLQNRRALIAASQQDTSPQSTESAWRTTQE